MRNIHDAYLFDFLELVHAEDAFCVTTVGANFLSEAL